MLGHMATMEIRDKDNSESVPVSEALQRTGCCASASDLDKCGPDGQPGHSRKKIILALHHQFQEQLKLSQTISDQLNVLAAQATGMEGLLTAALQSLPSSKPCHEPKNDSCSTEKNETQVKSRCHKSSRMPRHTANVASHSPAPAMLQPPTQRHNHARENPQASRDNLPAADLINSHDSIGSISACHSNNSDIANNRNDSFNHLHRQESSSAQLPMSLSPLSSTASLDSSPLWPAPIYPNGAALPCPSPNHAASAAMALPCTDPSPSTAAQITMLPCMSALTSRRSDQFPVGNLGWRNSFASEYAARNAGITTFDVRLNSGCPNPQFGCGTYGTTGSRVIKAGKSCRGELPPSGASNSATTATDALALSGVVMGVADQRQQLSAKALVAQHERRQRYEQEQLRQLWQQRQQRQLQQQPLGAGPMCDKTDVNMSPWMTSLTPSIELQANHSLGPMQVNSQSLQQGPNTHLLRVMESQGSPMPTTQLAALARQRHQAPEVQLRPSEQQQLQPPQQPQQQQPPRNRKRRQEHRTAASSSQLPVCQMSPPTSLASTPPLMTLSHPMLQFVPISGPVVNEHTPLTSNTSSPSGIVMLSQGTMPPFAPAAPLAAMLPHTGEGARRWESAAAVMAAGVQLAMR